MSSEPQCPRRQACKAMRPPSTTPLSCCSADASVNLWATSVGPTLRATPNIAPIAPLAAQMRFARWRGKRPAGCDESGEGNVKDAPFGHPAKKCPAVRAGRGELCVHLQRRPIGAVSVGPEQKSPGGEGKPIIWNELMRTSEAGRIGCHRVYRERVDLPF
jgi:hypothetical protein